MTEGKKSGFAELAKESSLYPQEKLMKVKSGSKSLNISIPSEISYQESRIALTPAATGILVNNGQEVLVEQSAGKKTFFLDNDFSEQGSKIVYSNKEAFEANIIVKVEPPTLKEIALMKPGSTLFSALQLGSSSAEYFNALNRKKITAIGYEMLEDKVGGLPIVNAMSELAGSMAIPIASELMSTVSGGKGVVLGGITGVPPSRVIILGAGTVGEYSARAALGLGAEVRIFDNELYKLRRIKHKLGSQVFTSTIDSVTLAQSLKSADVVIGALRAEKGRARCVVTEEMVSQMKSGAVIIDVSIDQGGCIETSECTSHAKPTFTKYDVIHYCVPNIASRAARSATTALSNILTPVLLKIAEVGGVDDMMYQYGWFNKGVYAYKGSTTNLAIARRFNLPFKDLGLLLAARF
ncbi:alanine dehydrogenase [Roseivirga seohaensis]|uniref:alanine dehydrogenase n=1 Tax=Roseivirga seohaensis TaxID=1914963 RepID=A0A150Y4B2_9BACT|nr:alanine dehydrogenase [Roseivirga seohaensis]KYG85807.1 alanine dehydrogenase [Roseivirga seohaensis]|tara:strand:+ start:3283 stop:4509 length:1227 start_codon:yes stop_codon:yes gene_type:complete